MFHVLYQIEFDIHEFQGYDIVQNGFDLQNKDWNKRYVNQYEINTYFLFMYLTFI